MAIVLLSAASAAVALAAGAGDDRKVALAQLRILDAKLAKKPILKEPVSRAHTALARAQDARAASDETHATLLDGLAREWAESGAELLRASDLEADANEAHRRATEAEAKAVRARALLEETVARRGRAAAQLKELEKSAVPAAAAPARAEPKKKPAAAGGKK